MSTNKNSFAVTDLKTARTAKSQLTAETATLSQAIKAMQGTFENNKSLYLAIGIKNGKEINHKVIASLWSGALKNEEGNYMLWTKVNYQLDKQTAYTKNDKGAYVPAKVWKLTELQSFSVNTIIEGLIQSTFKTECELERAELVATNSVTDMYLCRRIKNGNKITLEYFQNFF